MSKEKVVSLKDKKDKKDRKELLENVVAAAQLMDEQDAKRATEIAEKQNTALAAASEVNFFEDAGKGLEGADKDSFAIPFLQVLQASSPQVDEEDGVEGARPGMMINTVSGRLMKEARIIPVAFKRRFLRWVPRDSGGGFRGEMMPSEVDALVASKAAVPGVGEDGKPRNWLVYEGDELKDTRIHFVLLEVDGGWTWAIMSMGSTQIKRSKRLLAVINELKMKGPNGQIFTPPSFSHVYKVTTVKEENSKGKWYSFDINLEGPVTDPQAYAMAKEFHKQIAAGTVVVKHEQDPDAGVDADGEKF